MNYHLSVKSRNKKTGPIPVSTSSAKTCPDSCPLKKHGCYGDAGPLNWHWKKVTEGRAGGSWSEFLESIKAIKADQLWRHNQVGDLPPSADNAELINSEQLSQLADANTGRRGFTFTHYNPAAGKNAEHIASANEAGFTINLSGNNLDHADKLASTKAGPVVSVLPAEYGRRHKGAEWLETMQVFRRRIKALPSKTPAGNKIAICPATFMDTDCKACGLCQKKGRSSIVGFPAHGPSTKKADLIASTGARI